MTDIEYQDRGCNLHPSCLACPLARCQYDEPAYQRASARQNERERKVRALIDDGLTPNEIADHLGISIRTVYRALEGMAA